MKHYLQNTKLAICVDEKGAELRSIKRNSDQTEYLWQGDPKYWEGQSPILFPTVGSVNNGTICHRGTTYSMPKHGLVKEMCFQFSQLDAHSMTFHVAANEDTIAHYPFPFLLRITYRLAENQLEVEFQIENPADQPLPFHLGAHPAFNLPDFSADDDVHAYLMFDVSDKLVGNGLKPGGLLWPEGSFDVPLVAHRQLPITNQTFDCDTILDSRGIAHECTLLNRKKEPVATVRFDSPILALWALNGGCAPFVCIEPWWGCCDRFDYQGEFSNRPWTNIVPPHETKVIKYSIIFH